MPRKKSGLFDQSKYIQQFIKSKITVKKVMFNNENDADLLAWLEGRKFSTYIKELIREDINKGEMMMPDRKKVIKGLECCLDFYEPQCDKCPYKATEEERNHVDWGCHKDDLQCDALELLKEMEAVEPKQIVRKQCKTEHSDGSVDYYAEWFCPHCNSLLKRGFDATWIEYCFKCGKPITWKGR